MIDEVFSKKYKPSGKGTLRLNDDEIIKYLKEVPSWKVIAENKELKLYKEFDFVDFKKIMYFVNKIAAITEKNEHHSMMFVEYKSVKIGWWTHVIIGLHENDFLMTVKPMKFLMFFLRKDVFNV